MMERIWPPQVREYTRRFNGTIDSGLRFLSSQTGSGWSGGQAMTTILLIILILILVGALPTWGYSSGWGYGPSGIVTILLIVLIVMMVTGRV